MKAQASSSTRITTAIGLIVVMAACATTSRATRDSAADGPLAPRSLSVSRTVFQQTDLATVPTIVDALRARVPNLRIRRSNGGCPMVTLRAARAVNEISSPLVYVDGTRTVGTCALVDVAPHDVERVEIYPSGVTPRPGYARSSNGLILVFLKHAG